MVTGPLWLFFILSNQIVGCKIPADMRMIEMLSNQLRVDQAILTGISFVYLIL